MRASIDFHRVHLATSLSSIYPVICVTQFRGARAGGREAAALSGGGDRAVLPLGEEQADVREGGCRRAARGLPALEEPRRAAQYGARALRALVRPRQLHHDAQRRRRSAPAR